MPNASARPEQPQNSQSSEPPNKPTFKWGSVAGVLQFLYSRAAGNLDTEDLQFLSGSSELASHMAMNLSSVVTGIGCLVSYDDQPEKTTAGNFRHSSDFPDLMFTIANVVDVIGEFANMGAESSSRLREARSHG